MDFLKQKKGVEKEVRMQFKVHGRVGRAWTSTILGHCPQRTHNKWHYPGFC